LRSIQQRHEVAARCGIETGRNSQFRTKLKSTRLESDDAANTKTVHRSNGTGYSGKKKGSPDVRSKIDLVGAVPQPLQRKIEG